MGSSATVGDDSPHRIPSPHPPRWSPPYLRLSGLEKLLDSGPSYRDCGPGSSRRGADKGTARCGPRALRKRSPRPTVLALAGHSPILASAGSSLQSLLWQNIHQSLLLRDPVISPCSGRTSINPCCRVIQSTILALAGSSTTLVDQGRPSGSFCRRICSAPGPREAEGAEGKDL
ncbi:hypothetical protein ACLKA7_000849 [Drosophila subpalustris]